MTYPAVTLSATSIGLKPETPSRLFIQSLLRFAGKRVGQRNHTHLIFYSL
jgi:hypothetical protein